MSDQQQLDFDFEFKERMLFEEAKQSAIATTRMVGIVVLTNLIIFGAIILCFLVKVN